MKNLNKKNRKRIKHYKFLFLLIILSIIGIDVNAQSLTDKQIVDETTVIYNQVFLDLGFYLPDSWKPQDGITAVQNLKGDTTAFTINFTNIETNSFLNIQFYKEPNAKIIFDDKNNKFINKSNRIDTIETLGQKSFISKEVREYNGKGQLMDNKIEVFILDFMHPMQTGLFELQYSFEVKGSNVEEKKTFKKLIQSLTLIN
jgi:hypothetical protein